MIRPLKALSPAAAIVAVPLAMAALPTTALAQYIGPGSGGVQQTVASVLKDGQDNQLVVLRGTLTKQLRSDKYMFADSTGEIRVEIDNRLLPAQPLTASTRIEVRGELERDFVQSPEIDVESLSVLPAE